MNKTIENKLSKTLFCEDEFRHEWKCGEILHKGIFSKVYSAFLVNIGQIIAVKQVEYECSELSDFSNIHDRDDAQKIYDDEYKEKYNFLKELDHINVVKFLGTSFDEPCTGWVWVVNIFMENISGSTIKELLQKYGPIEEDRLKDFTRQITEGLNYLHARNVVHYNVQSRSIMLMPNGIIKIIDFDCAKRLKIRKFIIRKTLKLKYLIGDCYHMAPEVIEETKHGLKADIWSLGVTVFEMATGKNPWDKKSPINAIFAIKSELVPNLPNTLSQDVKDFTKYCLNRDQHARPYSYDLLNHKFLKNET